MGLQMQAHKRTNDMKVATLFAVLISLSFAAVAQPSHAKTQAAMSGYNCQAIYQECMQNGEGATLCRQDYIECLHGF